MLLHWREQDRVHGSLSSKQRKPLPKPTMPWLPVRTLCMFLVIPILLAAQLSFAQAPTKAPLPLPATNPATIIPALQGLILTTTRGPEAKAEAQNLFNQGGDLNRNGKTGEAWRFLEHARAVAMGKPWTAKEEFVVSLVLRPDTPVTDPSRPLFVRLSQRYKAEYQPTNNLRLQVSLIEPTTERKVVRDFGTFEGIPLDIVDPPYGFDLSLEGLSGGRYHIAVSVMDGPTALGSLEAAVYVVPNLDSQYVSVRKRLAGIKGHEGTKARILYPFDTARTVNSGIREPAIFDYVAEIAQSLKLLKALESGKDLLFQAKGDLKKAYWFAEAGEVMPYRIYVPRKWNKKTKLPLVLHLHGQGVDENSAFEREAGMPYAKEINGLLAKVSEERGYIAMAPLGYRVSGAWGGSGTFLPQMGNPSPGDTVPVPDPARRRVLDLAEKDLMNTIDLVTKEYNVDTSRIYLTGNSMGMGGVMYIAGKDPKRWAAIAPSAGPYHAASYYPYARYKGLPIMIIHGDKDPIALTNNSRMLVDKLKEAGVDVTYLEVTGLSVPTIHTMSWYTVLPQMFDFLDKHRRE